MLLDISTIGQRNILQTASSTESVDPSARSRSVARVVRSFSVPSVGYVVEVLTVDRKHLIRFIAASAFVAVISGVRAAFVSARRAKHHPNETTIKKRLSLVLLFVTVTATKVNVHLSSVS